MLPDTSMINITLVMLSVVSTETSTGSAFGLSSSMVTDSVVGVVVWPSETVTGTVTVVSSSWPATRMIDRPAQRQVIGAGIGDRGRDNRRRAGLADQRAIGVLEGRRDRHPARRQRRTRSTQGHRQRIAVRIRSGDRAARGRAVRRVEASWQRVGYPVRQALLRHRHGCRA